MKIGFITKFPVDFYDTMVDAAKDWNKDHPEVELIFAQGASGTDDEGEIAAIESMVTQGVKAIAITPTSPNVQDALQKAVDAGIKVVLVDNDIPGWDGKVSVVATDNLAGGELAGEFMEGQLPAGDTIGILEGVPGAPSLRATRRPASRRVSATASTSCASLPTDCDQTKGLNAAQDILTANPDVDGDLRRLRPADPRCARGDQDCRQDHQVPSASTPGRTRSRRSWPATRLASVAQFPAKMGELGADRLRSTLRTARTLHANIDTGTAMVTKDNAADFQ